MRSRDKIEFKHALAANTATRSDWLKRKTSLISDKRGIVFIRNGYRTRIAMDGTSIWVQIGLME